MSRLEYPIDLGDGRRNFVDLLATRWFVALPKTSADGRQIAAAMLDQVRRLSNDVAALAGATPKKKVRVGVVGRRFRKPANELVLIAGASPLPIRDRPSSYAEQPARESVCLPKMV